MDRKAWIVITLCIAAMIFNGWWMATHPQPVAPVAPAPTVKTEEVKAAGSAASVNAPAPAPQAPDKDEKTVELKNAEVSYTFTTKGGGIAHAVMLTTKDHIKLNERGRAAIGALGNAAKSYDDLNYTIVDQSASRVVFEAEAADKMLIRKEYSFSEGSGSNDHLLNFKVTLTNRGQAKVSRDNYYLYTGAAASLRPDEVEPPAFCWNNAGDAANQPTSSFRDGAGFLGFGGPIMELQQKYQNPDRLRWAGVMSRFYATVISTKEDQPGKLWAERFLINHSADEFKDNAKAQSDYAIHGGMGLPTVELEPNAVKIFDLRIYIGAKIYKDLANIDNAEAQPDRQHRYVMFYGMFSFVSRILVAGLRMFHDWTGNWGVAIILLTFCVRLSLWPFQAKSNATMKRMGLLSPKIKELQVKFKDDPTRQQQETMKLYKEYGVNPLGGCLPMFIQIPIFFGFYAVLRYAAELRGQPFLGWVHDLSLPDTVGAFNLLGYHIDINPLPMLMGVTMFLQMKLTPQPQATDKTQQRIFMLMPFMFLFFCYNFASALALYWTGQNIFSILQAQVTRLWQKDPVLEKVKMVPVVATSSPGSFSGQKQKSKKDKLSAPRLGGGGTNSKK